MRSTIQRICLTSLLILSLTSSAHASLITNPYTYVNGQTLPANQLNSSFSTIYTDYNGNITDANIASGAAINPTKLNATGVFPLMLSGAGTVIIDFGETGDTQPRLAIRSNGDIRFGPGGSGALDCSIVRAAGPVISFRDGTNSSDIGITAGTGVFSGAVTLTGGLNTPLVPAQGGTGSSTVPTSAQIPIGNGGGTAYAPKTVSGDVTLSNAGAVTLATVNSNVGSFTNATITVNGKGLITAASSGSSPATFGGNGSDGAVTVTTTSFNSKTWYATTFASTGSDTFNCTDCVINATSTITFANSSLLNAAGTGYAPGYGQPTASEQGMSGWGPAAGTGGDAGLFSSSTVYGGGGGGSPVAAGGDAGGASGGSGRGGVPITTGSASASAIRLGSGGGSGATGATGISGAGGGGGGIARLYANGAISLGTGSPISVAGAGGIGAVASTAAGSGGGGGGSAWLFSATSIALGTSGVNASGGAGGNASGTATGGGGGAGGYVLQMSPSNTGTANVGAGGGGTGSAAGSSGTAGTLATYTQTPTLPTIVYCEDARGILAQAHLERGRRWLRGESLEHLCFTQHEGTTWLAAYYCKPGHFDQLCYLLNNGGTIDEAVAQSSVDISKTVSDLRADPTVLQAFPGVRQEAQTCDDTDFLRPSA